MAEAEQTRAERLAVDRDRLEAAIASAEAHVLPGLIREHRLVLAEIDKLAAPKEGSTRDQLAERRAARKSARKPARKSSAARTPSS